jgi:hypothetical protein
MVGITFRTGLDAVKLYGRITDLLGLNAEDGDSAI